MPKIRGGVRSKTTPKWNPKSSTALNNVGNKIMQSIPKIARTMPKAANLMGAFRTPEAVKAPRELISSAMSAMMSNRTKFQQDDAGRYANIMDTQRARNLLALKKNAFNENFTQYMRMAPAGVTPAPNRISNVFSDGYRINPRPHRSDPN